MITVLLAALFVSFFSVLYPLVRTVFTRVGVRQRLRYPLNAAKKRWRQMTPIVLQTAGGHLRHLLAASGTDMPLVHFVWLSLLLGTGGVAAGVLLFEGVKGSLVCLAVPACLPYLLVYMRLINLQMRTRLEFLPAVEVIYRCYVTFGKENGAKHSLQAALTQKRLPIPLRPVFERLLRQLLLQEDRERALRLFRVSLGHRWADYFCSLLRLDLEEGINIEGGLRELIMDMRRAQKEDEKERSRLMEIRIANFTPVLFLALFLGVNLYMNPEASYFYYLIDPGGRDLLLDALLLIFASFFMGIYLSVKRM